MSDDQIESIERHNARALAARWITAISVAIWVGFATLWVSSHWCAL